MNTTSFIKLTALYPLIKGMKAVLILLITGTVMLSCKKYLAEKPIKSEAVPESLADLQALLDFNSFLNQQSSPGMLDVVTDDYYVVSANNQGERLNYLWDPTATHLNSWRSVYQRPIYYSNVVLDQLPVIHYNSGETNKFNYIKGSALFYRAFAFYNLAQLYCRPYSSTAGSDPGIVVRTTAAIEPIPVRSTVQQTYDQIISDLKEAANLLPESVSFTTRPTKAAAFGALARTYLSMRDYENAGKYSDSCLKRNNVLMDFNSLDSTTTIPIDRFNTETIFFSFPIVTNLTAAATAKIDTVLYRSYATRDLRKVIFFRRNTDGSYRFKGSYAGISGSNIPFNGITTSEMYLIKAESAARAGNKDVALQYLNSLLEKRWATGELVQVTAASATEALSKILVERRKELVFRGVRWSDVRRFNLDGANITFTRLFNNMTYSLPPNDLRWVLLIPNEEIRISNISQNPR